MQQNDNSPKASDEIDLTQFFKWIGRGFNRMGNSMLYGLASMRNLFFNNRLFFAGVMIIGLLLGATYSALLKKTYYTSTMVLSCDYLNSQLMDNTVHKLNMLCAEPEREGLMEVLSIDSATANNVQKFIFKPFVSENEVVEMELLKEQLNNVAADKKDLVEKVINKLVTVNKNAYEISVEVYEPNVVKVLEKALVAYFKNNEYVRHRIEINKTILTQRKTKLVRESNKLDSLKTVLFDNYRQMGKTSRGSNNVILSDETLTNPLDVFTRDLQLHTEMLTIDRALFIQPDFEMIDGFTTFKEPDSASLVKILAISFFVSWVMGYLIIGVSRLDQLLATYQPKT